MITDRRAYARVREREERERLARMSIEESIAVGEALLTSEVMTLAVFPQRERARSLAIALGIATTKRV